MGPSWQDDARLSGDFRGDSKLKIRCEQLTPPLDWDEIAEIIEDAFRIVGPKKLIAQLNDR